MDGADAGKVEVGEEGGHGGGEAEVDRGWR